jgi:hypothetical protein
MSDRYIKAILTVIAIELLWIGVKDIATPVAAQQAVQPTPIVAAQALPVVIRGIELANPSRPVDSRGALPIYAAQTLNVDAERPLPVVSTAPLKIENDRNKPLYIDATRPLPVQSAPYTPGKTPGE